MDPLEELIIKDKCRELSLRFGRFQDERRYSDLPGLMTDDGTYTRLDEELAISDFIEWVGTMPKNKTRHFVTDIDFSEIDEAFAQGISYYTLYLYNGEEEAPYPLDGPFVIGEYHEKFAMINNGWKIKSREARIIFRKSK
jgi:hypothetical protein